MKVVLTRLLRDWSNCLVIGLLLLCGCRPVHEQIELEIIPKVELAAEGENADWIGIAESELDDGTTFFEKILELEHPYPRGASLGISLERDEGAPLPSVRVYRGQGKRVDTEKFVGEYRLAEWPRPGARSIHFEVGFQVTPEQSLVMWMEDSGINAKGPNEPGRKTPVRLVKVGAL